MRCTTAATGGLQSDLESPRSSADSCRPQSPAEPRRLANLDVQGAAVFDEAAFLHEPFLKAKREVREAIAVNIADKLCRHDAFGAGVGDHLVASSEALGHS